MHARPEDGRRAELLTTTWMAPSLTPPRSTLAYAAPLSRLAKPSSAVGLAGVGGVVDTMLPVISPYQSWNHQPPFLVVFEARRLPSRPGWATSCAYDMHMPSTWNRSNLAIIGDDVGQPSTVRSPAPLYSLMLMGRGEMPICVSSAR